jgi:hypothetical protein
MTGPGPPNLWASNPNPVLTLGIRASSVPVDPSSTLEVIRIRDLEVVPVTRHGHNPTPCRLDEAGIVRGVVGWVESVRLDQRAGGEALRRLDKDQAPTVHGRDDRLAVDTLHRVGNRYHRNDTFDIPSPETFQDSCDEGGRHQGPSDVMDKYPGGAVHMLDSRRHRIPTALPTGDSTRDVTHNDHVMDALRSEPIHGDLPQLDAADREGSFRTPEPGAATSCDDDRSCGPVTVQVGHRITRREGRPSAAPDRAS